MTLELYHLRTFVTVARHRHLTKAAQVLHLTQPAVSGHIKALEERLNLRLFERSASGVALTAAGEALLPRAEAILSAVAALRNAAVELQGHLTGKATVGTILDPHFIRLGEFVNALRQRHPSLDIELRQGISPWVMDGVSEGTLDAAFFMGDKVRPNVRANELARLAYRVVAPPGWKAKIEHAEWPDLADLPWVRGLSNSPHMHMICEALGRYGLTPRKAVEADQESTISRLVATGVGLGLMREDLAFEAQNRGDVYVWSKDRLETRLSFVFLVERAHDPVIAAMDQVLRELWGVAASTPLSTD